MKQKFPFKLSNYVDVDETELYSLILIIVVVYIVFSNVVSCYQFYSYHKDLIQACKETPACYNDPEMKRYINDQQETSN